MASERTDLQTDAEGKDETEIPVLLKIIKSRAFKIGTALLVLYTLVGFYLVPYLVERYVPRILEKNLICEASIGKVRVNPFVFTFEANDFRIFEPDGSHVSGFDRLFLDFELSSLFRWAFTFKAFQLENPKVSIVMEKDGIVNLAKLIPEKMPTEEESGSQSPKEKDAAPPRLVVHNIELQNGVIHIADLRQTEPAQADILPLNISLERISTLPEHKGPYSLKANLADGGILAWTGTITLHPLKSSGNLGFSDIKVRTLWKFIRDSVDIQEPGGVMDFNTDYALDLSGEVPQMSLNNFRFQLQDLAVQLSGEDQPFFRLAESRISGARFDLASQKLAVDKISFMNGAAHVTMDPDGVLNLQKIVRNSPGTSDSAPADDASGDPATANTGAQVRPWDISIDDIEIGNLAASFEDNSRSPGLVAGVDELGVKFSVNAQVGSGDPQVKVEHINTSLKEVLVGRQDEAAPLIRVSSLGLEEGDFDLAPQQFTAFRVLLERGHIDVVREPDGQINLVKLFMPPQGSSEDGQVEKPAAQENGFKFLVKNVELVEFDTSVYDHTVKTDGTILGLENINVELTNVDGKSPMDVYLELEVDQGGSIGVSGVVDPAVPSVKTEVSITELALGVLQPYIEPHAGIALRSGVLATRGVFAYGKPGAEAELTYNGRFNVARLNITEQGAEETLLGWKNLKASSIKFQLNPDLLEIPDLSLTNLDGKFIIAEDGSTNVSHVVKAGQAPPEKAETQARSEKGNEDLFPVFINKLRVEDGNLYFADLSLNPQFATRIHNLDGVVIGVSSAPDSRAQVQLDGQVDEYGSTEIDGEISTFDPVTYTDIAMVFRNLEMNSMTPYSGKFVGRRIDSGKLSLDLKYQVENSQLLGDNQIIVDNLTLGERVESSNAISLPLNLAIAILEDENGIIDIGMPVSGNLEDPKFSYGHLIWKAFMNLIKKIATSPFRALGAMLGEDTEDLDAIIFENGAFEVPPPEKEKLHRLAQALGKRPQLKVVVQGRYSTASDGLELKALNVRRLLAERMGVELDPGEDPGPVDYGNPEIQAALESIYAERFGAENLEALKASLTESQTAEDGKKKSDDSSQSKKTDDPGFISKALYAKLVAEEPLDESVLIALADTRAQTIIFELVDAGKLAPERIATRESEALPAGETVAAKLELDAL